MAKIKKSISLKNVFIDPCDVMSLQEIDKEECRFYNLAAIAREFAGLNDVSIVFTQMGDVVSVGEDGDTDE